MKAIGSSIWSLPRAIGHGIWRLCSLIHNSDDIRETYGDNPNGLSDEERLIARAVASNTASMPNGGGGW
jgi:hypothetical protein